MRRNSTLSAINVSVCVSIPYTHVSSSINSVPPTHPPSLHFFFPLSLQALLISRPRRRSSPPSLSISRLGNFYGNASLIYPLRLLLLSHSCVWRTYLFFSLASAKYITFFQTFRFGSFPALSSLSLISFSFYPLVSLTFDFSGPRLPWESLERDFRAVGWIARGGRERERKREKKEEEEGSSEGIWGSVR